MAIYGKLKQGWSGRNRSKRGRLACRGGTGYAETKSTKCACTRVSSGAYSYKCAPHPQSSGRYLLLMNFITASQCGAPRSAACEARRAAGRLRLKLRDNAIVLFVYLASTPDSLSWPSGGIRARKLVQRLLLECCLLPIRGGLVRCAAPTAARRSTIQETGQRH